jgi:hypothetical protein
LTWAQIAGVNSRHLGAARQPYYGQPGLLPAEAAHTTFEVAVELARLGDFKRLDAAVGRLPNG